MTRINSLATTTSRPGAPSVKRGARRILNVLLALVVVTGTIGFSAPGGPALAAAPTSYYVEETGHAVGEPFLSAWVYAGGEDALGLPVTDETTIENAAGQYFQFGALRAASPQDSSADIVDIGREALAPSERALPPVGGKRIGGDRFVTDRVFSERDDPRKDGVIFDASTSHTISGKIRGFYERHNGVETLGAPLTESYVTGAKRVQWFERGRLEWTVAGGEVKKGAVGVEVALRDGVSLAPSDQGQLPVYSAKRFTRFLGDGMVPEARRAFEPVRILIPAIRVDAPIEQVGITDGVMDVPVDPWAVGWYPAIAAPGEWTNVVAAGHRDWWGVGPVVFWDLERLEPGDKIYLIGPDGSGSTYQVYDKAAIDADTHAREVVGDDGREMLTLITCGGTFDGAEYAERWIIRAERI